MYWLAKNKNVHVRLITIHKPPPKKPNQAGIIGWVLLIGILCALAASATIAYRYVNAQRASAIPEVRSGIAGYCLDDFHDSTAANAVVDTWPCNGTAAQGWVVSGNFIKHAGNGCLSIEGGGQTQGDKIVSSACTGAATQIWSVDLSGFENPASGLCLSLPNHQTKVQLIADSCNNLATRSEAWSAGTWSNVNYADVACSGSEGQVVACYAQKQWALWQSGSPSHKTLLNEYSDGNSYEEWCADFVSYVYKQAGYPFTLGERSGWDEYLAPNIQNMSFSLHPAAGYSPRPGDVAFFSYNGGHVEIVVSGGQHPTFIYGDSGTTDPTTGNGEMNEDTLTNDGSAGQVVYYLSPN